MSFVNRKIVPIAGAIVIVVPVYLIYLWFHAWNLAGASHPKAVHIYDSYLPEILRGDDTITLVSLAFNALVLILNVLVLPKQTKGFKVFSMIIIVIAGILALANLWSMM
jgi:hypothetical protein